MNLVLAHASYYIRSDRSIDHTEYDVFDPNDMKDMAKGFEDIMKPGGLVHVF